jgi:hypothetical protein
MMIEGHAPGCDGRHTPRQPCNAPTVVASFDEPLPEDEGAFAEALPEDEGAPEEAMLIAEDELGVRRTKAVADGPLEVIDTTKMPLLPAIVLVVVTLAVALIVMRILTAPSPTP